MDQPLLARTMSMTDLEDSYISAADRLQDIDLGGIGADERYPPSPLLLPRGYHVVTMASPAGPTRLSLRQQSVGPAQARTEGRSCRRSPQAQRALLAPLLAPRHQPLSGAESDHQPALALQVRLGCRCTLETAD